MGVKVHDCIGLIKGYMWCKDPEDTKPVYAQGYPDVSADMQLNRSKRKGDIKTLPEVPGVLVFMKGHVGVYLGNGEVIEARGHKFGVVITKLNERAWKNWGYVDEIQYL
jgi:cell wall-associated NlpC family hydrolase